MPLYKKTKYTKAIAKLEVKSRMILIQRLESKMTNDIDYRYHYQY